MRGSPRYMYDGGMLTLPTAAPWRHRNGFDHESGSRSVRVNVNTTDATTGATALLLPAQNTHTLHDPIRNPEHARAGGVEDGFRV